MHIYILFCLGSLNRSCRLSTAHGRQRVSTVLSAMDLADSTSQLLYFRI